MNGEYSNNTVKKLIHDAQVKKELSGIIGDIFSKKLGDCGRDCQNQKKK